MDLQDGTVPDPQGPFQPENLGIEPGETVGPRKVVPLVV